MLRVFSQESMLEDRAPIEKAAEIAGDEGICGCLSFTGAGGEVLRSSVKQRGWVPAVVHKEAWGLQRWRGASVVKSLEKAAAGRSNGFSFYSSAYGFGS